MHAKCNGVSPCELRLLILQPRDIAFCINSIHSVSLRFIKLFSIWVQKLSAAKSGDLAVGMDMGVQWVWTVGADTVGTSRGYGQCVRTEKSQKPSHFLDYAHKNSNVKKIIRTGADPLTRCRETDQSQQ